MSNNGFVYTYSADSKEELLRIREKYSPIEESNAEKIKKLDNAVTNKAVTVSLAVGVISTLVMGLGMCCCLVWTLLFVIGIFLGTAGIVGICLAYPVYKYVLDKERKKTAPEILALLDEELKEQKK